MCHAGLKFKFTEARHKGLIDQVFITTVDLLSKTTLSQQNHLNGRLIRDPDIDHLNNNKASHGELNQALLQRRVTERKPLLKKVEPQHHGKEV